MKRFALKLLNQKNRYFFTRNIEDIPMLNKFTGPQIDIDVSMIVQQASKNKKFLVETYGCQMNVSDTEIVNAILQKDGYQMTQNQEEADIILINTCAIRENAEQKVWSRLQEIRGLKNGLKIEKNKIIAVLGCMAERLKEELIIKNQVVDIVVGPDAYRDLPKLISMIQPDEKQSAINVQLSFDETYADITPVRISETNPVAFVSIMRGCNNMCSFCIVPFTRGRERSRDLESILKEVEHLRDQGVKEIVFLGQNVNSYHDQSAIHVEEEHKNSQGFKELYTLRKGRGHRFSTLLEEAALLAPEVRFRFTSPHPKDFPDSVLDVINAYPNICKSIQMPAQSGNTEVLHSMRRYYSREAYISLAEHIRKKIPGCTLSSDFIVGFCGESDEAFQDTVSLLKIIKYEQAFLFAYSMREKTHAHRQLNDDIPEKVKQERLRKLIDTYQQTLEEITQQEIGRFHLILIDSLGKKQNQLKGKSDTNRTVIVEQILVSKQLDEFIIKGIKNKQLDVIRQQIDLMDIQQKTQIEKGQFILCQITGHNVKSLYGTAISICSLQQFSLLTNGRPFLD